MANQPIPTLPAAIALDGSEEFELVQPGGTNGTTKRATAAQIGTYVTTTYPPAVITSIDTAAPLQGGPFNAGNPSGTISLQNNGITNNYLAQMAAGTVKANITAGVANPADATVSQVLDTISSTQGSVLYRSNSGWVALPPGTNTYVLTAGGPGANISWQYRASFDPANVAITGGTINNTVIGGTTPAAGTFTTLTAASLTFSAPATITNATWNGTVIGVSYGGTGANNAADARLNLGAAKSGANSDITSLSGLITPLSAPQGGTGFSSYTTGDLLYANTGSTLARLNDVATGNVLLSGGVGVAPAWGKVALTTHVSGILPVANGGTGVNTLTGYVKGNGTSPFTAAATIPNADLQNSAITIGSDTISLGGSTSTLAGLTTVTLTQDPTAALQAATKQYVDNSISSTSNTTYHSASKAATTAALTASYSNGTGGVGATLTNTGTLAAFAVDGYSASLNDRILVKNQASALQNGIYTVTTVGSGAVAWVLTRATDFDTTGTGPNYIETGAATFIQSGTTLAASSWVMNTPSPITVGTTGLNWTQISSATPLTFNAPLNLSGTTVSLNTVTVPFGGTGLTSYAVGDILYASGATALSSLADVATGNVLLSGGVGVAPSYGKVGLTTHVSGTLPVTNGGTGTATAFTAGSVVFAGASGVYGQNNAEFFWDNANTFLGLGTATPRTSLTIVSATQTTTPAGAGLPAGTDLYIVGADSANTRITQDAYGTGNYPAYTGRQARGTAASPTASQTDDILVEVTGRGYGTSAFSSSSVVRIDMEAAENFTNTAQGTYISFHTSALGTASATERFRVGPSGQLGIGGATYGTANYVLTSAGPSAAPTWSQVSLSAGVTGVLPVANGGTNASSASITAFNNITGYTASGATGTTSTNLVFSTSPTLVTPTLGVASATSLAVTGSGAPANGIYLPTANNVGIAANSALQLNVQGTASAVNYLNVTGSIASNAAGPTISAVGSDGSIPITIAPKGNSNLFVTPGTSSLRINGTYSAAGSIAMIISSDNGNGNSGALQFMVTPSGSGTNYAAARMHAENTNNSPTIDGGSWNLWTADQDASHTMVKRLKIDNLGILQAGYNVTTGAKYFTATGTSSAVNYMQVTGTATGVAAKITATGSDTNVDFTAQTQGTGKFNFQTNLGTTQAQILDTASAANYLTFTGSVAANGYGPLIAAAGGDTNIPLTHVTKGTGTHYFSTNGSSSNVQAVISHTASAVNYVQMTGAATGGRPYIWFSGSDTNVNGGYYARGSGDHRFFNDSGNTTLFIVQGGTTSVNRLTVSAEATGNSPYIIAGGSDTNVGFDLFSKGTGNIRLGTASGTPQVYITDTASAVDYVGLTGDASGGGPKLYSAGTSTNIHMRYSTKGTHYHRFYNGNFGSEIFRAEGDASAVNYILTHARSTGNAPYISATGTDTNVGLNLYTQGTGVLAVLTGGGTQFQVLDTASANRNVRITGSNGGSPSITTSAGNLSITSATSTVDITGTLTTTGLVTPRVVALADATSVTFNADTTDIATQANTQVAGTLTVNAPTGTPVNGQKLIFRLRSTNAQTFSWNAAFVGSTDLALPTTSSGGSKYDYVGFIYNSTSLTWQLLAKVFGF